MRRILIELSSKKRGIFGYMASLIYYTYGAIKSGSDLKLAAMQAYNRQGFDIFRGIDTFETLTVDKEYSKNIDSPDLIQAVNATSDKVERIKKSVLYLLNTRITREDTTFIDFGCGKGRSLIVSHDLGFKSLVGVELSPYILDICRKNLEKLKIECNLINASIKDVDYGSLNLSKKNILIYAYNPTSIDILIESISSLLSSLTKQQNFFLIYTNPQGLINNDVLKQAKLIKKAHKIDIYSLN